MKSLWWWPERPTKKSRWALVLVSAVALSLGWYIPWLGWLGVAVGFVPLLMLHQGLASKRKAGTRLFLWLWLAFSLWNVATCWWIWNSTAAGAIAAWVLNAALMTLPWLLWHKLQLRRPDSTLARWSLMPLWVIFEWGHMHWDLSWSWLNLGNALAFAAPLAQYYRWTGALGGTIWLLTLNLLVWEALRAWRVGQPSRARVLIFSKLLGAIGISLGLYWAVPLPQGKTVEVVVVQPNIDPYTEKFADSPDYIPAEEQIRRLIRLSEQQIGPETEYLLWPETCLSEQVSENALEENPSLRQIKAWLEKYPRLNLVTGAVSYRFYSDRASAGRAARQSGNDWYEIFNSALWLRAGQPVQVYHKSRLVPGVEQMPYPEVFGPLANLVVDLGGTAGSLGTQPERVAFGLAGPVICYESIYGSFVGEYSQAGARFIALITNDGWWGNTPGHKHHWHYARLRAIETGQWVARSANTGISGFINPRGEEVQQTRWWTPDVRKHLISLPESPSLYSRWGDWVVGLMALGLGLCLFGKDRWLGL